MPLLTDRQEPEDYDRGRQPEDPNEYALRYLFQPNRPGVEYQRTGQTLFYAGVATNWLAFGLYAAWLEFNLWVWPVALALLLVSLSSLAARLFYRHRRSGAFWLATLVAGLAVLFVAVGLLGGLPGDQAGYFFFFLPGSLTSFLGFLLLRASLRS